MCGGKVKLEITTKEGEYLSWGIPKFAHQSTNTGNYDKESCKEALSSRSPTHKVPDSHSPKKVFPKKPIIPQNPSALLIPIKNLPGKRKATKAVEEKSSRCAVCKIVFQSKVDVEMDKKHKVLNQFMGCMGPDCDHWANVRCAKLSEKDKRSINNVEDIERLIYICSEQCNLSQC